MKRLIILLSIVSFITCSSAAAVAKKEGKIAFVKKTEGKEGEIYVINEDGTNLIQLTHNNMYDNRPVWSPDGNRIAFECGEYICTMDADGKNQKQVSILLKKETADGKSMDRKPSWSPDGKHILFVRDAKDYESNRLYTVHFDGTDQREVTPQGLLFKKYCQASWSPKGDRIAFASYDMKEKEKKGLYLINRDGAGLITLLLEESPTGFSWSPNGNSLVFSIFSISSVSELAKYWKQIGKNADENRFYFAVESSKLSEIATVNTDNSGFNTLVSWRDCIEGKTKFYGNQLINGRPLWSPDGSKIAFVSTRNFSGKGYAKRQLFVINLKNKQTRLLLDESIEEPAGWSPDGSKVLFVNDKNMIGYVPVNEIRKAIYLSEGYSPCWWAP